MSTRLFSWLRGFSADELQGTLEAIYVAPAAGATMEPLTAVRAIAGRGLEGDRYARDAGHWRATDACQVTLVDAAEMQKATGDSGLPFAAGGHRRNLVVSGIPMVALRNREVRIGEARFRFHRLRPPCGYLERLLGRGAVKALRNRGGVGLTVVEGGMMRVGDRVEVVAGNVNRES